MAQVYSVNAVGYVNTTLTGGKFNLVANPLDNKTGNNVANILAGVPDGTVVYKYGATGYEDPNAYDELLGGWGNAAQELKPGEGAFILLPAGADKVVTFVGEVMQGDLKNPLPKNFSIKSSMVPQEGKLVADLKYPVADGDVIYTYSPTAGYTIYGYDELLGGWDPLVGEPNIAVGQAFWVLKLNAGSWDRSFSVNQ